MTKRLSAIVAAIGLACISFSSQAAVLDVAGEYTVTYDDALFGPIDFWTSGGFGARTFNWTIPLDGNGDSVISHDGTGSTSYALPSITIEAHAGQQLSDLAFHVTGGVFKGGTASVNGFGNYSGAASSGPWTLDLSIPSAGTFTSWTAPAGSLILDRTGKVASGGMYADTASFSFTISAVPEPETYAMMLAGLGAIGFMARRRQRG